MRTLERLMQLLQSQQAGGTGQDLPADGKVGPSGNGDASSDAPSPAPPLTSAGAGDQFAKDTLSGLIDAQNQANGLLVRAEKLISKVDANGDGSLSLQEIADALSPSTTASASTASGSDTAAGDSATNPATAFADAFAKLDSNGDGQISADELATALKAYKPHHRHHHHGGGEPVQAKAAEVVPPTPAVAMDTTESTTATAEPTAA